jgi:hypothetical protein
VNTAQRWIALVAVVALILSTIYPPFCFGFGGDDCAAQTFGWRMGAGHHLLWWSPPINPEAKHLLKDNPALLIRLDWWRLCIQYVGILAICGAAFVIFDRDPRRFLPDFSYLNRDKRIALWVWGGISILVACCGGIGYGVVLFIFSYCAIRFEWGPRD